MVAILALITIRSGGVRSAAARAADAQDNPGSAVDE